MNQKSIELIKFDETSNGEPVLVPYKDTEEILTVGWGHNLEKPITEERALDYFHDDLAEMMHAVVKYDWYHQLDDVRQAVIENMMFNLGATRFAKFKKMIAALAVGDYRQARDEMIDSKWHRQTKSRAIRLEMMMFTGEWPA